MNKLHFTLSLLLKNRDNQFNRIAMLKTPLNTLVGK